MHDQRSELSHYVSYEEHQLYLGSLMDRQITGSKLLEVTVGSQFTGALSGKKRFKKILP